MASNRPAGNDKRAQVWDTTRGHCHLCGEEVDSNWQMEHVVPKWKGGSDEVWNLLPACSICNGTKRSGVDMCVRLLVGKYAHTLIFKPETLSKDNRELGERLGAYIDKKDMLNAGKVKGEPKRLNLWQAARKGKST